MRKKNLFSCMLGGLLALWGCSPKAMPDGDLIGIRYVSSGTIARPDGSGLGRVYGYMEQLIQDGV